MEATERILGASRSTNRDWLVSLCITISAVGGNQSQYVAPPSANNCNFVQRNFRDLLSKPQVPPESKGN
ncbi:hypothetical protein CYMTET_18021 [Cymbomonas tetramitiformis]|uniref:Uncharacterized protein n=1 Tax=Cymbomonas tetramitiformis TaxID=36881 RepID=A0AAE0L6B6_9CHLO|nr:hypothetical protein CYMTET_18021 [Cymbomonas tetramitiformis]